MRKHAARPDALARAEADGHTLGVITNSFAVNPAIKQPLTYDTLRDFAGLALVSEAPSIVVVNPQFVALPAFAAITLGCAGWSAC